jgi:ATP synthase protein I
MPESDPSRDEALARLEERANALEARETQGQIDWGQQASSQAYRILAELIGGVLVGCAIGFGVDWFAGTTPWGMIVGVLIGFGVAVWMAKRTADRLMKLAKSEGDPMKSVPFDDEDED